MLGLVHHRRSLKVSSHIIKDSTVRNRFTDDFHVLKEYLTKPIGHLWTKSRLRLRHNSITKSNNSSGPEPDAIVNFEKDAGVPQQDICSVYKYLHSLQNHTL